MDRSSFVDRLTRASKSCRDFARTFVFDSLPEAPRYFVNLNQSYDENPLREGEVTFPHDVEEHGRRVGPIDAEAAVSLLWRNGAVPEWIDISVCAVDQQSTYFELLCCGRFAAREELLYYRWDDQPGLPVAPFGIKSPAFPLRLAKEFGSEERNPKKFWLSESPGWQR